MRSTTTGAGDYGQPVISYYAPVSFGTPPKSFNIAFDIAFSELFVPHFTYNPFKINLHYKKGFQCKVSSSCVKNNTSFVFDYQNCTMTGKQYEDVITFTNAFGPGVVNVSLRQKFLAISDATTTRFKDLPADGFFGLGPSTHYSGSKNILVGLVEAHLIDNLQFSLWFNPVLDSNQGGELVLGGVDQARYQGQVYWHRLASVSNQWSLMLQYVGLGGQIVGHSARAILSSGLNEIYGPREEVRQIYSLLNTTRQQRGELELIDCRRLPSLPVLTFTIDGIPYALLPSNYIRKTTDGSIFKSETCYVAILASNEAGKWILGTSFLQAYYSIFDMTYQQVGFASLS